MKMKKTLFLLTIIICSVGSVFSMGLNQFFQNKNVSIEIGNVINNRDEDLLFNHDNNIFIVPANDSAYWGYSLLPLQQRGLSRSPSEKNWGMHPITITASDESVTGLFSILVTVLNDQLIKLKASFNLENHEHQNVSSNTYEIEKSDIKSGQLYRVDVVIGENQNESKVSVKPFDAAGPR
jgi:hypothetical protein